ncbi:MAG: DNA mismatch repair endonuclease MutL [Planctomycetes bacterium]|nr:DNA mismatch repair endonuclease MutL [Planctomycetota bacterium]
MPAIQILPEAIANKIAAGEVIERPASVVKELVENAIDAGAAKVDVSIEDGGRRLIRVADDGAGMSPEDLALAFESHATSKLGAVDDLFDIRTLGFRGEALPSIGAISQAKIISRLRGNATGAEVEMNGGEIGAIKARGAPEGTTVEVRNLFFNVPVRRKFLKAASTEMGHINEALTRIALCYPRVRFNLYHNDRSALSLPQVEEPAERIAGLFGKDLAHDLIHLRDQGEGLTIRGYTAPPQHTRANSKLQYIFLNGRYIRDRSIMAAIAQSYQGMLLPKRFAIVFLFLKIDPALVDVNVHPTKVEVRFRDSGSVFRRVRAALTEHLKNANIKPELKLPGGKSFHGMKAATQPRSDSVRRAIADYFESSPKAPPVRPRQTQFRPRGPGVPAPSTARSSLAQPREIPTAGPGTVCQIHNTYIVEETEDGLNVIDQHALHERVLFEELEERAKKAQVAKQRLLIPVTIQLSPKEFADIMDLKEELDRIGVEVDEFGNNAIAVHALPQVMGGCDAEDFVRELLEDLSQEGAKVSLVDKRRKMLEVAACKGAVKAGQKLTPEAIQGLLKRRGKLRMGATCPHGRPTTLSFSLFELEKQFKRK